MTVQDRDEASAVPDAAPAGPTWVGPWRTIVAGAWVFAPVVVVDAVVQAVLVSSDPVPEATFGFGLLVGGSALAMLISVWLTVCAAAAAAVGQPRSALRRALQCWPVAGWALLAGVIAVAASTVELWLAPVVLIVGAFPLTASAMGRRNVLTGFRTLIRAPIRTAITVLAALVLAAASWAIALALALFLTGPLAAGLTWAWFGLVGTLLLCRWCSLDARTSAQSAVFGRSAPLVTFRGNGIERNGTLG